MKKKNLISLTVAFAFLALSITGILLFIKQKAHATEITHTIFGLTFVGFAIFHIINNWSSITGYSKDRKSGSYQKEFIIAGSIFGVLLIGGLTEILEPVAEAGRIFAGKRPPKAEQLTFNKIETNKDINGTKLKIMIQKGKDIELPVMAIWTEDSTHAFIENLFVPARIAQMPESEEEAREGHFDISDFKPELLANWAAKASNKKSNFENETPKENFILITTTKSMGSFYLKMEVKAGNKTEVYETLVNKKTGEVFKLNSPNNQLISSALVEL
jgi:Domain of unknown function (DUF4405)